MMRLRSDMSRSTYIYLGFNHADELLGAWTVKHELVTYGKDAMGLRGGLVMHSDYHVARVTRVCDGSAAGQPDHRAVDITEEVLKEIGG